jgi:hypothetical protein
MSSQIVQQQKQRILELKDDEIWEPFHDKINDMMIQEKKARSENNTDDGAKVCREIVSNYY